MSLTWPKVISGGFALFCATAAGTWVVAWSVYDTRAQALQDKVESYESLAGHDLPKLIKDLGQIAGDASSALQLKELTLRHEKLQADYDGINELNAELMKSVTIDEEFTLTAGKSHAIFGGRAIIGLQSLFKSYAFVSFDNYERAWHLGKSERRDSGGIEYRVTLMEISGIPPLTAKFRVDRLEQSQ